MRVLSCCGDPPRILNLGCKLDWYPGPQRHSGFVHWRRILVEFSRAMHFFQKTRLLIQPNRIWYWSKFFYRFFYSFCETLGIPLGASQKNRGIGKLLKILFNSSFKPPLHTCIDITNHFIGAIKIPLGALQPQSQKCSLFLRGSYRWRVMKKANIVRFILTSKSLISDQYQNKKQDLISPLFWSLIRWCL